MIQKKIKLVAVLFFLLGNMVLHAQEVISTAGGEALGGGGTVSFTVGQIVYKTNTGTGGSEEQGVQQPFEISMVTEIEEGNGITLQFSVYPNPVTEILILKIEGKLQPHYVLSLYNIHGELLEYKNIVSFETSIDMKKLLPATYFLKVNDANKEVKIFKIIKN